MTYTAAPDPLDPDNSLPDREMNIAIVGTDLTWDDITFVGDNIPPVLVPIIQFVSGLTHIKAFPLA